MRTLCLLFCAPNYQRRTMSRTPWWKIHSWSSGSLCPGQTLPGILRSFWCHLLEFRFEDTAEITSRPTLQTTFKRCWDRTSKKIFDILHAWQLILVSFLILTHPLTTALKTKWVRLRRDLKQCLCATAQLAEVPEKKTRISSPSRCLLSFIKSVMKIFAGKDTMPLPNLTAARTHFPVYHCWCIVISFTQHR